MPPSHKSRFGNAKKWFITAPNPIRIDQLLIQHMGHLDNPLLPLQSGGVWLDKARISDGSHLLQKGQTLVVYTATTQGEQYVLPDHAILYQTVDWIAVYKPPALSIGSDRSNEHYNLTFGVSQWLKRQGLSYSPTPITRLDFMVNGLTLYATNKQAEKELFSLTRERKIGKLYLARLDPVPNPIPYLRIRDTLGFTSKACVDKEGKPAHSLFRLREKHPTYDLYSVVILTGRRHQIRFHASAYLSPIIGDDWYGSKTKTKSSLLGLTAIGYSIPYKGRRIRLRLKDLRAYESPVGDKEDAPLLGQKTV